MSKVKSKKSEARNGFTLMELLIVIAIIAILATALIVSINPARHFRNARHATRWQHMESVATAIYTYAVEKGGDYPRSEADDYVCIGSPTGDPVTIDVVVDEDGLPAEGTWCWNILVPDYLRIPPTDPLPGKKYQIQFVNTDEDAIRITSTADEAQDDDVFLIK